MARIGILLLIAFIANTAVDGLSVMSVDLGSEWMKIAIVSPGVPMEIVLNKESKRKTPTAISFRDGEREFSDGALHTGIRFPDKSYRYILDLVGKKIDNPMVQLFQKRFPYHRVTADAERGTVLFTLDNGAQFSPEELLAQILSKAKEYAQDFTNQPIKDAVITVPVFFNQAERRSVQFAAEMAGLKVLQLMSDNAAVALNYGIFRRKDFNVTQQRVVFYDMGASSTVATVVGYQVVKTKDKYGTESNPQLTILGVGYDRTLGGLELTLRLRDYLATKFNEMKLTTKKVEESARAMAKLLKEAERVKMVLSANTEHIAQVEGVLDEKDFKYPISRQEFEALGEDFFLRVAAPLEAALQSAEMTKDEIDKIIIVGAGTRTPRVQEALLKATGLTELGKSLNTDEAAALGAVYQAAHLSQGFKVKKFIVKEATLFPIQVSFNRELEQSEGDGVRTVTRTLFGYLNPFPQKKVMTFNKHLKDFAFSVNYGDLSHLSSEEKLSFGSLNISTVHLSGVQDALQKHADDGSDAKGVKAHFRVDESGILNLDIVESIFEKKVTELIETEAEESTLSKLGSTISRLFSGVGTSPEPVPDLTGDAASPEDTKEEPNASTVNATVTPNATAENATVTSNSTLGNATDEVPKNATEVKSVEKIVSLKEQISIQKDVLDLPDPSTDSLKAARKKLRKLEQKEREKAEREEAQNALESFIIETQNKLYEAEYEAASTEEERETIRLSLSVVSEWLEDEGINAETTAYQTKLSGLKSQVSSLMNRVREHQERPEAVSALREMINMSQIFLDRAKNLSEDEQVFTEVELSTLDKTIVETKTWLEEKETEQEALKLTETPALAVYNLAEKISLLDREVKYLVNKARISKPKKSKDESTKDESTKTKTKSKTSKEETETPQETESATPHSEDPHENKRPMEDSEIPEPTPTEDEPHSEL